MQIRVSLAVLAFAFTVAILSVPHAEAHHSFAAEFSYDEAGAGTTITDPRNFAWEYKALGSGVIYEHSYPIGTTAASRRSSASTTPRAQFRSAPR